MNQQTNGFYSVYFTGLTGVGFGLIILKDGIITGTDTEGIFYDGEYFLTENGLVGNIQMKVPPNVHLVTGTNSGQSNLQMKFDLNLPKDFGNGQTLRIETPTGPVNASFKKLREIK